MSEDSDALLTNIGYYMLLCLHARVRGRSCQSLCTTIVSAFGDKMLARGYTERND